MFVCDRYLIAQTLLMCEDCLFFFDRIRLMMMVFNSVYCHHIRKGNAHGFRGVDTFRMNTGKLSFLTCCLQSGREV